MHINVAHPGLTRLFGHSYGIEAQEWIDKMWGTLCEAAVGSWSERSYQKLLPPVAHLPPERQRLWTYFKLWPNLAFDTGPLSTSEVCLRSFARRMRSLIPESRNPSNSHP
jgi:hypothetical protein